ncbi:hypothetical protein [Streptomyces sp. TP-A0356]|uniref:hypothetical protein n=1 Tax=Streptomyces sp. TP-A0356 TaxID=1359208 RepID=UPI0006E376E1|nr:hypothetical protein [Streptomyces sp. TP-A0356]
MNTTLKEPRPVIPRVFGAAVTGAVLATGAGHYLSWVKRHSNQACESIDGLCFTWWDLTAIPLVITIALVVLIVVYKQLGIRPRLAVIPPTILLAPLPLEAAQTTAGSWAATIVGGAWSCGFALAAWSRYRILGITVSATLLLGSLIVLYR